MTTVLLVIAGLWILISLLFCVALGMAAAKPMPQPGANEETLEAESQRLEPQGSTQPVALAP